MSANLIGFGADLQQKLDAMHHKQRCAPWAGYAADDLYRIAQRMHALSEQARSGETTSAHDRAERRLIERARVSVQTLGRGIEVYRQPDLKLLERGVGAKFGNFWGSFNGRSFNERKGREEGRTNESGTNYNGPAVCL